MVRRKECELLALLGKFKAVRVLVVGDLMLDVYTRGVVSRISPEAPVPVLHVTKEESLPGGAGNVMLNLVSLGATVQALGRVGDDPAGKKILHFLSQEGVAISDVELDLAYQTPVKNRLIADSQQVIRIDRETVTPLSQSLETQMVHKIPQLLNKIDVIAISDYGKGFLSNTFLASLIREAKERGVPVIADPKGDDFSKYSGATILKPNAQEAFLAAKAIKGSSLNLIAAALLQSTRVEYLVITRSELGISFYSQEGEEGHFPVVSQDVKDVTGAGDAVLAVLTVGFASGLSIQEAIQLANLAGSLAIKHVGCVRIKVSDLARELLALGGNLKIFDRDHLLALEGPDPREGYQLLVMDKSEGVSTELFRTIRFLGSQEGGLILYVKDGDCFKESDDFLFFLSSFQEIDFIVLDPDKFALMADQVSIKKVFSIESGQLMEISLEEFRAGVVL